MGGGREGGGPGGRGGLISLFVTEFVRACVLDVKIDCTLNVGFK